MASKTAAAAAPFASASASASTTSTIPAPPSVDDVRSALRCLASPPQQHSQQREEPHLHGARVRRAQEALLSWEGADPDAYTRRLLVLLSASAEEDEGDRGFGLGTVGSAGEAAGIRLAAVLSLKAAASRRWKDRGRGSLTFRRKGINSNAAAASNGRRMGEAAKSEVRRSVLSLVLTGRTIREAGIDDLIFRSAAAPPEVLLRDRPLQTGASALLAKIGRLDLPLKFHELIPSLVAGASVAGSDPADAAADNASEALEMILSELTAKRLLADKNYLSAAAVEHLGVVADRRLAPALNDVDALLFGTAAPGTSGVGDRHAVVLRASTTARVVSHLIGSSLPSLVDDGGDGSAAAATDRTFSIIHSCLVRWLPVRTARRIHDAAECSLSLTLPSPTNPWSEPLDELLHVLLGTVVETQRAYPAAFSRYLEPYLGLCHEYVASAACRVRKVSGAGAGENFGECVEFDDNDPILVSSLAFLANVAGAETYNPPAAAAPPSDGGGGGAVALAAARRLVWDEFYSPSRILSLCDASLSSLAVLAPGRLSDWADDPESHHTWEDGERSVEDDAGAAAMDLFLALAESTAGRGVVVPWLAERLSDVPSQRRAAEREAGITAEEANGDGAGGMGEILRWDAVYAAAGSASHLLESHPGFEFRAWYDACLGPCLDLLLRGDGGGGSRRTTPPSPRRRSAPLYPFPPVLRRRIVWLVACNARSIDAAGASRHGALETICAVLASPSGGDGGDGSRNDAAVRLAAVQALEALLPGCEGDGRALSKVVEIAVPALYRLADDCEEVESRSSCLGLVATVLTCAGTASASSTAAAIGDDALNAAVGPLASIWGGSGTAPSPPSSGGRDPNSSLLLRRDVLSILSSVAALAGTDRAALLHPVALLMIDDGLCGEENAFLVDDALKVWWAFLRLSSKCGYDPAALGKLYFRAPALSRDLEHVKMLMRITECYIVLGGASFLNDHASALQTVLGNVVSQGLSPRGSSYVGLVVEALLRSFPSEGGELLVRCGVAKIYLDACALSFAKDEECDPDRVVVGYLAAFARMLLASPDALGTSLPVTMVSGSSFREEELVWLMIEKFNTAGHGAHGLLFQKLSASTLVSFLPPCQLSGSSAPSLSRVTLTNVNRVFGIFAYVLRNCPGGYTHNLVSYGVGYDSDEEAEDKAGSDAYDVVLQAHTAKDVVLCINFRAITTFKIQGLRDVLGPTVHQQLISAVDNKTLAELENLFANGPDLQR